MANRSFRPVEQIMHAITLEIPEDIVRHLRVPQRRAKKWLMQELTLRLFEEGIITAAQGSRLLGLDRLSFERLLADNEIPIHGGAEDLEADVRNLERA